jgi:Transposase
VARSKSDHADAMTLANILRVDAQLHRRLPTDSELCQAVAVLARGYQDAIWLRTKAHIKLRSMLRECYSAFLAVMAAFAGRFFARQRQPRSPRRAGHRAHPGCGSTRLLSPRRLHPPWSTGTRRPSRPPVTGR